MTNEFKDLLNYVVLYRKLRGRATNKLVMEQLILAYAKQLAVGMPEEHWRKNMLVLIEICQQQHDKQFKKDKRREKALKEKAEEHGLEYNL